MCERWLGHVAWRDRARRPAPDHSSAPIRLRRALWIAAACGASLAAPLAAQRAWQDNLYPYAYYSTIDGVWGGAHYGHSSPVGFLERPEPNLASVSLDAAASTQGSYALVLDVEAPAWWDGWRAAVTVSAQRDNRLGYYGLGNATRYVPDSVNTAGVYFYEVSRTRASARASIERRVVGPLRLLVGATLERTNFRALPGPSAFRRDLAAVALDAGTIPFTDRALRAGVVLDTRDHEIDPHTGVFVEALFASAKGYTRTTADARIHVHPVGRLVLAARLAGEGMGGTPPLAAEQDMQSSGQPFVAVGGYHSLRGYHDARFTGAGKLIGGLEARYALLWVPSVVELKAVAFYDAGRVFAAGEATRLTVLALHHAGGGELALRFLRNSLLVVGYGRSSEGGQLVFGTSWSY